MAATSHRRATPEIVAALQAAVTAVTWVPVAGADAAAVFDRVELFDDEDLVEAFRYLTVTEQRVCVIVPLDEQFETAVDKRKLIVRRMLPVALLMSDRVLGDRKQALWGDLAADGSQTTPGAMGLMEMVLPAVTGLLLPNPKGVVVEPARGEVMAVKDTEKDLPSRITVSLELHCRGGYLEADLGTGPVW
jgi:hypothetical protein